MGDKSIPSQVRSISGQGTQSLSAFRPAQVRKGDKTMRVNNSTTFTRNFNGEAIKPNEVMVPFEYTELEAEEAYALLNAIVEMFK